MHERGEKEGEDTHRCTRSSAASTGRSVSSPLCGNGKQQHCVGADCGLIINEQWGQDRTGQDRHGLQPGTHSHTQDGVLRFRRSGEVNGRKKKARPGWTASFTAP